MKYMNKCCFYNLILIQSPFIEDSEVNFPLQYESITPTDDWSETPLNKLLYISHHKYCNNSYITLLN